MSGEFDDPFGGHDHLGDHDDHLAFADHAGLGEDAMGADHDAGYHDAGYHDDTSYDHDSYDHAPEPDHDPEPAAEPAGVPEEHHVAADHEVEQLDGTDSLPHPVDTSPFPPHLEVDVSPVDGQDWVDPTHLGDPEPAYEPTTESPQALLAGLHETEGADPTTSDDPAIRALALYWSSR